MDETLLDLLACPQDKGPLLLVQRDGADELFYNPRLRRAYPIVLKTRIFSCNTSATAGRVTICAPLFCSPARR